MSDSLIFAVLCRGSSELTENFLIQSTSLLTPVSYHPKTFSKLSIVFIEASPLLSCKSTDDILSILRASKHLLPFLFRFFPIGETIFLFLQSSINPKSVFHFLRQFHVIFGLINSYNDIMMNIFHWQNRMQPSSFLVFPGCNCDLAILSLWTESFLCNCGTTSDESQFEYSLLVWWVKILSFVQSTFLYKMRGLRIKQVHLIYS